MKKNCFDPGSCLGVMGLVLWVLASCATGPELYHRIDRAVNTASYEDALAEIEAARTAASGKKNPRNQIYSEKNTILFNLDKGLLEHYAGNYEASYADLLQAERNIEDAYTKSLTQALSSYVVNDVVKDYAGEDYEDVYTNIFNALNAYHLNNGQALALINDLTAQGGELQVLTEKYSPDGSKAKQFLEETLKLAGTVFSFGSVTWPVPAQITFTNSALARYLAAVFCMADGNKDMARYNLFELRNAFSSPAYRSLTVPPALAVQGDRGSEQGPLLDIPAGKGQLNVLAFAGLSPIKIEKEERLFFPFLETPVLKFAVIKIPLLQPRPSAIRAVTASVQGGGAFKLDLLEDIDTVFTDTFNGRQSSVYLKTFARVLAKYIATDIAARAAKQAAQENGSSPLVTEAAVLGIALAAKKALDVTEAADTRSARYLPSKVYIGAVNLDPGTYTITVNFTGGPPVLRTVTIKAGMISLVEAVCLK
jgi:hypothetical protein